MGVKEQQSMYNAEQKDAFFQQFPQYDRFRPFFGKQLGFGAYEAKINTDIADMNFVDLEKACQEVKIYLPTQHLSRFKSTLNAYMEWQADNGNSNASELLCGLDRIKYDLAKHAKSYIVDNPNEIIAAIAAEFPPIRAYSEAIVAILYWAGMDYEMICSLSRDAVTASSDEVKIQVASHIFTIDDPVHVRLINAYLDIKNGQIVHRATYNPIVVLTDAFLLTVTSAHTNKATPMTADTLRKRMSAAFAKCCPEYLGGVLGVQKSGHFHRLYQAEKNGEIDLVRYLLKNEPTVPTSKTKLRELLDVYDLYKQLYH